MTRSASLLLAIVLVTLLGTANSGGYRFGASDQAFYIPAIAFAADQNLFPLDREVFEPQMRLWLGDEILGRVARATGTDLPALFALLHALTMISMVLAVVCLVRSLGGSWWAVACCLVLLTLRHRIARTGANSLEGYMHPRMLAFAWGLAALAFVAWRRPVAAGLATVLSAIVHTSTALWFGIAIAVASAWPHRHRRPVRLASFAAAAAAVIGAALFVPSLERMDNEWLAVLAERDYLFSADWPIYAWLTNLAYPAVLVAVHRRRLARGLVRAGESGLVAGLLSLVLLFLVSVPLAEMRVAFFVQLQANRVFWLLDAAVAAYLAWWMADDVAARWPQRWKTAGVGLLLLLSASRGTFVLQETGRPLLQIAPAGNADWIDAMTWLKTQPSTWHVLADPAHALKYGISVRAAAFKDTPLEAGKDPAMAMYDRNLARRVSERTAALSDFDSWSTDDQIRTIDARYGIDVFVDRSDRGFSFPVLFRNDSFVVYDLR